MNCSHNSYIHYSKLPLSSPTMRNLVIITDSSSSIVTRHHNHNHNLQLFIPKHSPIFSPQKPISLSLSKPTSQPSPSPSSSSSSSPLISPQLVPPNGDEPINNPSYYADIASKLVKDGRFEDFEMVVDIVFSSGVDGFLGFGKWLDLELVMVGVVKGLREGRIKSFVGLLGCFSQLGIDVLRMFDDSAMDLLKKECVKIVKNGNLEDVVEVMEILAGFRFQIRELVNSSDMIRAFVVRHSPSLAVRYVSLLQNADIFICTVIREFGKKADLVSALEVFEAFKQKMTSNNMYVYRTIIDVCGLCGDCFKSRFIYEDLLVQKVTPNIYVFNSLMNVNAHDLNYTMDVYKQMQSLGVEADMTSYNILLKACCLSGRVDLAMDIYKEVQRLESIGALKLDVFTYSTIVKVFADAKLWQLAIKIKEDMLSAGVSPNTVTWSSLISACANVGLVDQATKLFEEMLMTGSEPNSQCINSLLHACVEARQYDRAFRLFITWKNSGSSTTSHENSKDNKDAEDCSPSSPYSATASRHLSFARSIPFKPTTTTYNILLKACGADFYRAKALIDEMRMLGLSPNHISWSILIDICGGGENVEGALQILKSMSESGIRPDVVAYTTAIKVCVESKKLKTAFSLFAEMKRDRIKPNMVTYNTLLRARRRYGSLQEIQQCLAIYQDMRKAGYKSNDYYLKLLVEEWCEEVIQMSDLGGQCNSRNKADIGGLRSLLLERVATHLQKNTAKSFVVDIQGLTKVEARIVVLAVLRMIKENHSSGNHIEDDLVIILGMTKFGVDYCMVKDAITKLLKQELGLEVSSVKPIIKVERRIVDEKSATPITITSPSIHGIETTQLSPTRRPAVLQRLVVSNKSLNHWLQRRFCSST